MRVPNGGGMGLLRTRDFRPFELWEEGASVLRIPDAEIVVRFADEEIRDVQVRGLLDPLHPQSYLERSSVHWPPADPLAPHRARLGITGTALTFLALQAHSAADICRLLRAGHPGQEPLRPCDWRVLLVVAPTSRPGLWAG